MDDLIRYGIDARKDWSAYYTIVEEEHPRYHNRPDCEDGSRIDDKSIRAGTGDRPLCDRCRSAQGHTG